VLEGVHETFGFGFSWSFRRHRSRSKKFGGKACQCTSTIDANILATKSDSTKEVIASGDHFERCWVSLPLRRD